MNRFVFSLPVELEQDLAELAHKHHCSKADVIRMAIAQLVIVEDTKFNLFKEKLENKKRGK